MTRDEIAELPLYHEDRSCTAPTAARIFDQFAQVQRHHLMRDNERVQTFQHQLTKLTPLQAQPLDLLGVSHAAYTRTDSPEPGPRDGGRISTPRSAEREVYRLR